MMTRDYDVLVDIDIDIDIAAAAADDDDDDDEDDDDAKKWMIKAGMILLKLLESSDDDGG